MLFSVRKRLALSWPSSIFFFHRCFFSSRSISWYRSNRAQSSHRLAPEPGPSTCPSAWFSLSAGSNPWTSKNENHHTGVKHRLKKGHKNETHVYEHLLNFFSEKKGWLTGRRRGCCVGLFVAAASVCRLCGLVRSVGFKKIFNHFFSVITEITNHGHGRE